MVLRSFVNLYIKSVDNQRLKSIAKKVTQFVFPVGGLSSDDDDEDDLKENEISNIILPGSVMMTPTAGRPEKSPNKSVTWV